MPRTQVEADLSSKMSAFASDAPRVAVIDCARRFKASWIELAQALTKVLKAESFRGWGYGSFEEYCKKELHLRSETAMKLTGSYAFLHKQAPDVLRRDGVSQEFPDYRSVDFWQKAADHPDAPAEAVAQIRKAVIDEGATPGQLSRRFKDEVFPLDDEARAERGKAEVLRAARRLAELLAETAVVPKRLAADVEEQLGRLIEKLEAEA
jgi:hypothetical protein